MHEQAGSDSPAPTTVVEQRAAPASRRAALGVVALFLAVGLGFALLVPPLLGRDEAPHFLRAYHVSEGHVFATERTDDATDLCALPGGGEVEGEVLGGSVPAELVTAMSDLLAANFEDGTTARNDFLDQLGDPTPSGPRCVIDFRTTAVYAPLPYVPAAFGIAVTRVFGGSALVMVYAARIATLLVCAALVLRALTHARGARGAFAAVALLPVVVFQSSMVSADGTTVAMSVLAVALAWRIARSDGPVQRSLAVEAGLVVVALALMKLPALVLAVPLVFVAARRPDVRRTIAVATLVAAFAAAGWNAWSSSVFLPIEPMTFPDSYAYYDTDTAAQLERVLTRPWSFAAAVTRTMGHDGSRIGPEIFAQVAGTPTSTWWALVAMSAFAAAVLSVAGPPTRRERLGWAGVALVYATATLVLAYLGWNAVGAPRIDEFQGRYLVPCLPLLALALGHRVIPSSTRWLRAVVATPLFVASLAIALDVRDAFYT